MNLKAMFFKRRGAKIVGVTVVLIAAIVFFRPDSFTSVKIPFIKSEPINSLSGLPGGDGPLLVVKLDDTRSAHPQIGIEEADVQEDLLWLSSKIANLRIFSDANGVMNVSVKEKGGDVIVVSQFTLQASTKKGNRPSYIKAARPELALPIYESFVQQMESELGKKVQTGQFGADMKVALVNDGPVTLIIDTKNKE